MPTDEPVTPPPEVEAQLQKMAEGMAEPPQARPSLLKQQQLPTVGRIVHYNEHVMGDVVPRAAIVIRVWTGTCVNLKVFTEDGDHVRTSVTMSEDGTPGTWSWPPRS